MKSTFKTNMRQCLTCTNYLCSKKKATRFQSCTAKDHGFCSTCKDLADLGESNLWIIKPAEMYAPETTKLVIKWRRYGEIVTKLESKGYELIKTYGKGACKDCFLLKTKNNREFVAKMSYNKKLNFESKRSAVEIHKDEIKTQKLFGNLAVQAVDYFVIHDQHGNPIALVEIQDKVEVFYYLYLDAQRSERLAAKYPWRPMQDVTVKSVKKLRTDFRALQRKITAARLYVRDPHYNNVGYDNGKLKVLDLGIAGSLDLIIYT